MRFPPHPDGSDADNAIKGARRRQPRAPLTDPVQLTPTERRALRISAPLKGVEQSRVSRAVRNRLVKAGWLKSSADRLLLTEAGRRAMNATVLEPTRQDGTQQPGVLLKVGHGYTRIRARAVDDAGEVLDEWESPDTGHTRRANERHTAASDKKSTARAIGDLARAPLTLREDIAAMKQRQRGDAATDNKAA